MKVGIINGPNLNLLGDREQNIYGDETFSSFLSQLKEKYHEINIYYYQSNIEGELINKIHEWGNDFNGIVLNAGGYTHTSVAIGDAVKAVRIPIIEVHISNVFNREEFRQISHISASAQGVITGFGLKVYDLAIYALFDSYFLTKNPF